MPTKYYIIYGREDRGQLRVLGNTSEDNDMSPYVMASRKIFYDKEDAWTYCQELAVKHKKSFSAIIIWAQPQHHYLD